MLLVKTVGRDNVFRYALDLCALSRAPLRGSDLKHKDDRHFRTEQLGAFSRHRSASDQRRVALSSRSARSP